MIPLAKSRNPRQSVRRPAAKKRGGRGKLNKQTLMSMAAVGFVVVALLLVLGIKSIQLREKNASYEKTKKELETQIALEEDRAAEIDAYSEYVNSDEYIEKIARERLGLVGSNEIIFYSGDEENGGAVKATAEPDWDYDAEDSGYSEDDYSYSDDDYSYSEDDYSYSEDDSDYSEDDNSYSDDDYSYSEDDNSYSEEDTGE